MIKEIQLKNPTKIIETPHHPSFISYGRLLTGLDPSSLIETSLSLFSEGDGTTYVASSEKLESFPEAKRIQREYFGEMEIQVGCCYGMNTHLNGMEYHNSHEIIIASTDMILMVGKVEEIDKMGMWNSHHTRYFYLSKGDIVQLFSSTLHLAPNRVSKEPFNAIIILPKGTNEPLEGEPIGTLFKKNKWMLAHKEGPAAKNGAKIGIIGENLSIIT